MEKDKGDVVRFATRATVLIVRRRAWPFLLAVLLCCIAPHIALAQTDNESCLDCHNDPELVSDEGRVVGVLAKWFNASPHADTECVECHTTPGDYDDFPHYEYYTPVDCAECHDESRGEFAGSIHDDLFDDGDMACVTCHVIHRRDDTPVWAGGPCGTCHDDAVDEYATSVHWLGRRGHDGTGVSCASCHGAHNIVEVADSLSPVYERNIPNLCATCHKSDVVVTEDFVRLPIALAGYLESVHGVGWREDKKTATCTDCHGVHTIRIAEDPTSSTYHGHLAETCGQCHSQISVEYQNSVHGKAVALGINDSPTCTDCHDEHLIRKHLDPSARVSPEQRARALCGDCHTDPELVSRYGIQEAVLATYLDSYHAWAIERGSDLVATCTDCHNVHEIRSPLDPESSVNEAHLVETCSRCHESVTQSFATSYTHASALEPRGPHRWVRLVYLWLIAIVLGGMVIHNVIVARHEFGKHLRKRAAEPYIIRWHRIERAQHFVLLLSFTGLAITGFALRFPDTWWVKLIGLGGHEYLRATLHRTLAVILIVQSVYHMLWLAIARRGRWSLSELRLRPAMEITHAFQNMAYQLGLRRERPAFSAFDYTQKVEYWAVVWGIWIMTLTGLILWYPTIATQWMPAWVVRVSEVIHFYEAVLAVSAIFIWHFFYVIFLPSEYPMSTVWVNGRMPTEEWKETHRGEYDASLASPDPQPPDKD